MGRFIHPFHSLNNVLFLQSFLDQEVKRIFDVTLDSTVFFDETSTRIELYIAKYT